MLEICWVVLIPFAVNLLRFQQVDILDLETMVYHFPIIRTTTAR